MRMSVRKFLILVFALMAAMGVRAWEPTTADVLSENTLGQPPSMEALVSIAPVPVPATVTELASFPPKNTGLAQTKKLKAATEARAKSMLTRSAREQIALAKTSAQSDDKARLNASNDEEDDSGLDDLDLHRSYSQPKVAKVHDATDEDDSALDLPEHIKLRLFMARTKAVDAFILSQMDKAPDYQGDELSDTVKIRLCIARARAVKAHIEKYGAA